MTLEDYYWHLRDKEGDFDRELHAGWGSIIYDLEIRLNIPDDKRWY